MLFNRFFGWKAGFSWEFFAGWFGFSDDYEGSFHVGVCQLEFFGFFQAAAKDFDGGFGFGQFLLDSAGLVRYEVTTCLYIGQAVFG